MFRQLTTLSRPWSGADAFGRARARTSPRPSDVARGHPHQLLECVRRAHGTTGGSEGGGDALSAGLPSAMSRAAQMFIAARGGHDGSAAIPIPSDPPSPILDH